MAKKESDLVFRLRANIDDLEKKLGKSRKQLQSYKGFTKGVGSSVATSMSQIFGVGLGVSGLVQLGRSVFETTKQLDAMDKALKAISDTNEDLVTSQSYLARISETLGLEIKGLTQSYIAFTAASKGTGLEGEKSRTIFENVSKATAILGLSADDTTRALKAIAQMMSKGKVQAEELRQQLGDRVPGAFNVMAKSMGVTTAQLDKMLKDGKVIADEVLPNFSKELVKTFGGDKIDKIDTLVAAQNRMKNSWTNFIDSLNEGDGMITKTMTNLFNGVSDVLGLLSGEETVNQYFNALKSGKASLKELEAQYASLSAEVEYLNTARGKRATQASIALVNQQKEEKSALEEAIKSYKEYREIQRLAYDVADGGAETVESLTRKIQDHSRIVESASNHRNSLTKYTKDQVEESKKWIAVSNKAIEILQRLNNVNGETVKMSTPFASLTESEWNQLAEKYQSDFYGAMKRVSELSSKDDDLSPPLMDLDEEQLKGVDAYFETMRDVYGSNYRELINYAEALGMELNEVNGKHVLQAMQDMQELSSIAEGTIEGLISSFAEGLGTGGLEQAFQNFFDVFGQGLQNMGQALVAQGIALKAAALTFDPVTKIAAGVAAIAAGAAISNIAQNMSSGVSGGGGGVGTYGGSESSISNYQTQAVNVESRLYIDGKQLAYELENINSRDIIRRG